MSGFQLGVAVDYFNLVTDVIILLLPVAVVSRLHINLKQRSTWELELSLPFSAPRRKTESLALWLINQMHYFPRLIRPDLR